MNFDNYCFPPERERASRFTRSPAAVADRPVPSRRRRGNSAAELSCKLSKIYRHLPHNTKLPPARPLLLLEGDSPLPYLFVLPFFFHPFLLFFLPLRLFFFLFINIEPLAPRVIFGGVVSAIVTNLSYNSTRAL